MGARKLSALLHELLKPTPRKLTFVYYSQLRGSLFGWRHSWIDQVKHWPDPPHHLCAVILPEVTVFLQLCNVLLGIGL
jgi:hypothetical protein